MEIKMLDECVEVENLIHYLGPEGHLTITWDEDHKKDMIDFVSRKMNEGVTFWILEKRKFRVNKEVKISDSKDLKGQDSVTVHDEDVKKLLADSVIDLVKDPNDPDRFNVVRRAKTAQEVVENATVAHRRAAGG
jgi:hypothetical protein